MEHDPEKWNVFREKIMLKTSNEIMIRSDHIDNDF